MKISYSWLKQYVNLNASADEVADMLTGCGLEVESVELFQPVQGGLQGLVIGHVLEKIKHPNADKLSVTKVDIGDGNVYQVVCGAPNVEAGQKVVVATVGTMLYPIAGAPFEIKKSKIRGEISEGMICAEDEIGLGQSHDGIIILPPETPIGKTAAEFYNIHSDYVFEIGLTPNRADATSHIGVARDIVAVWNSNCLVESKGTDHLLVLNKPKIADFNPQITSPIEIGIEDSSACSRYSGIYLSGITVTESPSWLKDKLLSIGLKPINNIVDVSNYVMLETGQPLHAFDAGKISGNKINVKKLPAHTLFTTLDGIERKLSGEELMICDNLNGLCIAGVYGGINSGISETTTNLFLESAYFNPTLIRKGSKQHGLKTDASFRFERGADPDITVYALKRCVQLLKEMDTIDSYAEIQDYYPVPVKKTQVTLNLDKTAELTGVVIETKIIKEILSSLEIAVTGSTETELLLEVPPFKPDVKRPVDVIEEILRIYGYNRVDLPLKMNSCLPHFSRPDNMAIQARLSGFLSANGFNEIMGNSLTKTEYAGIEGVPGTPVKMLNPLSSDLAILRQSLLWSGLEAITYNRNRKNPDLKLFEVGKIYFQENGSYYEQNHLSVIMSGRRDKPNWNSKNEPYSIYYLKSLTRNLLALTGINISKMSFTESEDPLFSVSMSCIYNQKHIATFGLIKKQILKSFECEDDVFAIDIAMDLVYPYIQLKDLSIIEVPRHPEVKRDLSMVFDQHITYEQVEKIAIETERKLLKRIQLFDVYQGDKLETGKKSYAVSFILADDQKTLDDKQIENTMDRLMKNFEQKLGAVIRKS